MLIQVLTFLLLCSIAFSYFVPPVLFGNTVRDLYSNSTNDMNMLDTQWTWTSYGQNSYAQNNGFGGIVFLIYTSGKFGRTYDQLPAHNVIYFDITFEDIWDTVWGVLDMSGNSGNSYYIYSGSSLVGKIYDSSSSLTIGFSYTISEISEISESSVLEHSIPIPIRDISLSFRTEIIVSPMFSSVSTKYPWPSTADPMHYYGNMLPYCPLGYYLNGSSCVSCHASCQNCFASSNTGCYSCASGFSLIGNQCLQCPLNCAFCSGVNFGQCLLCNTGYTLDFDGTCNPSPTCKTSPFVIENNADVSPNTTNSISICVEPCPSGTSMLWNYTCTSSCIPPLQQVISNGVSYCEFPCNKTNNEYLYPNGSCLTNCDYSSNLRNETGYLFCGSLCPGYLYQNGSCFSTCPAPFVTGVYPLGVNACNYPCAANQYLYPNGSCSATCPPLYTVTVDINSVLFCSYPCASNEFLYSNGTCSLICENNFIIQTDGTNQFCNYPCQRGAYLYDNGTCLETCSPGFTASAHGLYQYCSFPCPDNTYSYTDGICSTCPFGTYQSGGTCNLCHSSCVTCNGPLAIQCLTCPTNEVLVDGTCICPPDIYAYVNGTCQTCPIGTYLSEGTCNTCDSSCLTCYGPSAFQCSSCPPNYFFDYWGRCICASNIYSYTNGSCVGYCEPEFLLSENGIWYCNPPNTSSTDNNTNSSSDGCTDSSFYKYQNGSCLSTCSYPYTSEWQNGSYFCNSPCNDGWFLYENGTCLPSCDSGFQMRIEDGITFCDSTTNDTNSTGNSTTTYNNGCSGANFYKYSNGSCLATCPSPFLFVWQNEAAYCDFPCASGYYISVNGSCITSCDPGETPQIKGYFMFCNSTSNNNTGNVSNNTSSVILEIYIRYNISLVDFNSLDGLKLFVQQLASLLGIDPSYITIVSIREGSTIIQSQISIASSSDQESMNTAMDLAETMGNTVSNAVANNGLDIINGVSILDYDKSIQVVKTGDTSVNQIQVSSRSSQSGAVIGLGAGLGAVGLIVLGFGIYRYKKRSKLRRMRTKQDTGTTKGEAYKVETNISKTKQDAKDESMARINEYKEGETVKSQQLDEIDVRIEGSQTNNKSKRSKQPVIELDVCLDVQVTDVELKSIRIERKASTIQEYNPEPNINLDSERRNDSSLESQEIQVGNQIEPDKQLSVVRALSPIEELDIYIEGQIDEQDEQDEQDGHNVVVAQRREAENQKVEKQMNDEENPMSLGALLRQNL